MFRNRLLALLLAVCCIAGLSCFSAEDFSGETPIAGICITSLPDKKVGSVMLGSRVLVPGDVLTAEQAAQMTFSPRLTELDETAEVGYLPIYPDGVEASAAMTIGIRGKENKPPVAEDSALETYKNLAADGKLKVVDPEGEDMVYAIVRRPKRGTVTLQPDGSFREDLPGSHRHRHHPQARRRDPVHRHGGQGLPVLRGVDEEHRDFLRGKRGGESLLRPGTDGEPGRVRHHAGQNAEHPRRRGADRRGVYRRNP